MSRKDVGYRIFFPKFERALLPRDTRGILDGREMWAMAGKKGVGGWGSGLVGCGPIRSGSQASCIGRAKPVRFTSSSRVRVPPETELRPFTPAARAGAEAAPSRLLCEPVAGYGSAAHGQTCRCACPITNRRASAAEGGFPARLPGRSLCPDGALRGGRERVSACSRPGAGFSASIDRICRFQRCAVFHIVGQTACFAQRFGGGVQD